MAHDLDILMQRLEAGTATPAELEIVRGELANDAWPLADLRAAVLAAGEVDVSIAVMAAIGAEILPVASAVQAEAGDVEVAAAVLAALSLEATAPVGEAVRQTAGDLDDVGAVMAALALDAGMPIAEAVAAEAGEIDLSDAVMGALGIEDLPVGEALVASAGPIDVADQVMAKLGGVEAMPDPARSAPALPAPANSRRWIGALLAAAMVMMVVGAGSLLGGGLIIGSMVRTGANHAGVGGVDIASAGGTRLLAPADLVFASAAEVVVEDLSFGDDVVVFQDEGDDGALILWVDEEVL